MQFSFWQTEVGVICSLVFDWGRCYVHFGVWQTEVGVLYSLVFEAGVMYTFVFDRPRQVCSTDWGRCYIQLGVCQTGTGVMMQVFCTVWCLTDWGRCVWQTEAGVVYSLVLDWGRCRVVYCPVTPDGRLGMSAWSSPPFWNLRAVISLSFFLGHLPGPVCPIVSVHFPELSQWQCSWWNIKMQELLSIPFFFPFSLSSINKMDGLLDSTSMSRPCLLF